MSIPTLTEKIGWDVTFIRGCCATTVKVLCDSYVMLCDSILQFFSCDYPPNG